MIENLLGTSNWRANFVTPADVIGLRQRWPKAVFQVMRERSVEMEDMRRLAYTGNEPAYRYTGRGYCPVCAEKSDFGLGRTYDVSPSRLGPVMAVPGRVVRCVERLRPGVPRSLQ